MSALQRKSITDLTRRKARAFFTVATLSLAVASVGIFAIPSLLDQNLQSVVTQSRLADVTLRLPPTQLTQEQLFNIAHLGNVQSAQMKSVYVTRMLIGSRREKALVVGVPDFRNQPVDEVAVVSGTAPGRGGLLNESFNAKKGRLDASAGDSVRILDSSGDLRSLRISGRASGFADRELAVWDSYVVLYASMQTVADLSGSDGITRLLLRLDDKSKAQAERTVAEVRAYLAANTNFRGFEDMPYIRPAGDYPGKTIFANFAKVLNIITLLALLSGMVLLSNTMTTLIGEQTGEIAAMKAVGATRKDIRGVYGRTAVLLGLLGTIGGLLLGVLIGNLLAGFFGSMFWGVQGSFRLDAPVMVASVLVGLIAPPLAALPAIRRAGRLPLVDALRATGSATGGQGRIDHALRRLRWLPRTTQVGLRNVGRRKRRSFATLLQVALAVATLLSMLSLGKALGDWTHGAWATYTWDVQVKSAPGKPLPANAMTAIATTPGVRAVTPNLLNMAKYGDRDIMLASIPPEPMTKIKLVAGRLATPEEDLEHARVAVVEKILADAEGLRVGGDFTTDTANGPQTFTIIGIADNLEGAGYGAFVPLSSLQSALGTPGLVSGYTVQANSTSHTYIDLLAARLEKKFLARGQHVAMEEKYMSERDNVQRNSMITTSVTVLGLLIVAISMVGLVNAITMAVLERTREIGILRCIGARGRDVRRIFATEGLIVSLLGWAVGVPLGYLLARGVLAAFNGALGLSVPFAFSGTHVLIALIGTVLLAVLVMLAPLRRAVRFKPGDALRYA